jgi:predicted nucleic acid-binding protein
MAFVLDASAALRWCFRDEATSDSDRLLTLAELGDTIYVPSHWPLEVLNGLVRAERRGRVSNDAIDTFLGSLAKYKIAVDLNSAVEQWNEALPLARQHQLSAYDAAYLALAKRLAMPLATFDDKLTEAAQAEGVPLAV